MNSTATFQTISVVYTYVIGNGASSVVFKAFDKKTGEHRAAKVIKDRSKYNLLDLNREIKTLKNLNHSNIVKLYGKETEIGTGRDVLILEYCQSSLYSFLHEPENLHGLRDQEFLILFDDIASGLQYLHSKGIIHRDLKPGNILRNIKPDLSPIYIISDFGTSRRLQYPEEEFFSLVGTEEFLHPTVYQSAFIDKKQVTPFNSGTDLWSFGCTLYQAISSRMPFRPFGGARNDREIMFQMVASKPPGCISAYQNRLGGDLIWESRFPENCPMSSNLQEIMREIISTLIEADPSKQITYKNLFITKDRLSTLFRLEVHLTSNGTTQTFYLDPSKSFAELQDQIAQYTDIPAGRQVLFYNDQILENLIQKKMNLNELLLQPPSINSLTLVVKQKEQNLAPYNIEPFPVYHNTNTINTDYQVTFERCQIVNNIMLLVSQALSFQLNITKTISAMWTMLKTMFLKVEKNYECLKELSDQTLFQIQKLKMLEGEKKYEYTSNSGHRRKKENGELLDLVDEVSKMKSQFGRVSECIVDLNRSCETYLQNSQQAYEMCTSDCSKKMTSYCDKIKEILGCIKKRKNKEILIEIENTKHLHDRGEAEEVCAASLALWQDHCWIHKQKSYEKFKILKRIFFDAKEKAKNGNILIAELRKLCYVIKQRLTKVYHDIFSPTLANRYYFHNDDGDAYIPSREKRLVRSGSLTDQDKRNLSSRARLKYTVSDYNGHGSGSSPMDTV